MRLNAFTACVSIVGAVSRGTRIEAGAARAGGADCACASAAHPSANPAAPSTATSLSVFIVPPLGASRNFIGACRTQNWTFIPTPGGGATWGEGRMRGDGTTVIRSRCSREVLQSLQDGIGSYAPDAHALFRIDRPGRDGPRHRRAGQQWRGEQEGRDRR